MEQKQEDKPIDAGNTTLGTVLGKISNVASGVITDTAGLGKSVRKGVDTGLGLPSKAATIVYDATGRIVNAADKQLLTPTDKFLRERAPVVRKLGEYALEDTSSAAMKGVNYTTRGIDRAISGAEYAAAKAAEARARLGVSSSKLAQQVWEKRPKTMAEYLLKGANALANIPTFYKLAFLVCFYFFFYKIFYDIGIFFGLSSVELILYMAWFGMLLFFVSFIKPNRSRLY
jgi:hypothetical protein